MVIFPSLNLFVFPKEGQRSCDKVIPTYCKKCGFMEIYKEMKGRRIRGL